MKVSFDREAWAEYLQWQREDVRVLENISGLIEECRRDPFRGTGKPEPLKRDLAGWWSRRITGEHRLIYRALRSGDAQVVEVLSCRYHY
ncbi:Txe/YoeB family addiction module toxin [Sphingomonas sp. SUN019]|uniref:Txe/YoeB family addiction module toxin n=1 Tax=Sphingomonas sp. SUN019 TaxID=2937788 RepID=UPI002164DDAE|nr:Txe/YoeB family addiction module toxin [Sphingomonas sp. SUN019]UVO51347.1 Txe/YoeB family addiction module toxin [Sphingomonas sp. SUN019]